MLKPRIDTYPHGEVRYCDCMDAEYGLPSLEDGSYELCFTDFPFNVELKGSDPKIEPNHRSINPDKIEYSDNRDDYKDFCSIVFKDLKRICIGLVLQVGELNVPMWCKIEEPVGFAYHLKRNSRTRTSITYRKMISPLLFYGKTNRINNNLFDHFVYNGFLRDLAPHKDLIHPCPLCEDFVLDLLKRLKPTSIIDCFLGSGTTAEVCEKLGIKWLGYEINEVYSQDIEKRLHNIKKEPKQVGLSRFIGK